MVFLDKYEAMVIIAFFGAFPFYRGLRKGGEYFSWQKELMSLRTLSWAFVVGLLISCILERLEPLRSLWKNYGTSHSGVLILASISLGWLLAAALRLGLISLGATMAGKATGENDQSEQDGESDS